MKKTVGSLLVAALLLTGCGSNSSNSGLKVYHDYETQSREVTSFNYLSDFQATNAQVYANFVDGLVENDNKGQIVESLAKDYSANDTKDVWTFHLRDGLKWLRQDGSEYGDVTAQDFVTAVKYSLDAENGSNNTSMITAFIKGADEYYEASEAGTATDEMFENVGVKAVDDKTVEFTLVGSKPYFDTVLTYGCYYPVNAEFLDEVGKENFGSEPDKILYNGCYLMDTYENGANKSYVKNEKYWDKDKVTFDRVEITMLETSSRALDMFETGELDRATLTQDQVLTEQGNENLVETPTGKYSFVIWFNHKQDGNDNWNKAVDNVNFRKTWFYGLDTTELRKRLNSINPDKIINQAYTASGLVQTSDGTDYTKLDELKEFTGDGVVQLQPEKAKEYKAKAMEELQAQGVTFPVKVMYAYKSGDQASEESYRILKQSFEDSLGSDFIDVEGVSFIKSSTSEIYAKSLQSIMISGWGADYGDPYNFLDQLTEEGTMNVNYVKYNDEKLNQMVEDADKVLDLDERYHAFAKVEAYVLDQAYVIPAYTAGHEIQMTKINDYSKPTSKYGMANLKIKNWESKEEAYTTEEYEKLEAESGR